LEPLPMQCFDGVGHAAEVCSSSVSSPKWRHADLGSRLNADGAARFKTHIMRLERFAESDRNVIFKHILLDPIHQTCDRAICIACQIR
jgi:hypothetical protein